jgi:hypothetical protein
MPPELDQAPVLGVLALLAAALDVAVMALLAEHPELADIDRPGWRPCSKGFAAADTIIRLADRMRRLIDAYRRRVLQPEPPPPSPPYDDIPF